MYLALDWLICSENTGKVCYPKSLQNRSCWQINARVEGPK
jgi:hypothetical protein